MVKSDFEIHGAILALICIAVVALVIVCVDVIVPEDGWTAPAEAPAITWPPQIWENAPRESTSRLGSLGRWNGRLGSLGPC